MYLFMLRTLCHRALSCLKIAWARGLLKTFPGIPVSSDFFHADRVGENAG